MIQRPNRQSSLDASLQLRTAGFHPVWHLVNRGRTRAAVAADLDRARDGGLTQVLCLRGDHAGTDRRDTPSIRETVDFAIHHRFCFGAFNILMPYAGTPLYERLAREGRLLYDGKWWLHPDYRFNHAAFRPRHLTPDELTEAAWDAKRRWNSVGSVFGRMWDFRTHLSSPARAFVYLAYNPLYRKENLKKQGMRFGYDAASIHPRVPGPLAGDGALAGAGV